MSTAPRVETITEASLQEAAKLIRAGELVAFPTETVYGLGADATNDHAVARIFEAKGLPQFNPLIVHVNDLKQAHRHAIFDKHANQLAEKFWPGALTFVLPSRPGSSVSKLARAGLKTVAVRAPIHPVARRLLELAKCPVAAPSANRSGHLSPTTARHVAEDLGADITLVLDGGPCLIGVESTIIDLSRTPPSLLRPGGIPSEDIAAELGELDIGNAKSIRAPGMLTNHYAPVTPVRLNAQDCKDSEALLAFGPTPIPDARVSANLSPTGDLVEAASNLFAMLHMLDATDCTAIVAMSVPEQGLGLAINDRLRRAAAGRE